MSYTNDTINNRAILAGDGFGWTYFSDPILAPSVDADQAIYIMRFWGDLAANTLETEDVISWDSALYHGLSFGIGPYIKEPNTGDIPANESRYADLLGSYQSTGTGAPSDTLAAQSSVDSGGDEDDYLVYADTGLAAGATHRVSDGNGGSGSTIEGHGITASKDDELMPFTLPISQAIGLTTTFIWHVRKNLSDDGVNLNCWVNTDTIDLDAINLLTGLDPDNPKATFPVSNSWEFPLTEINGVAEDGTNWIPTSGSMAFPTHFLARWPFSGSSITVDYRGVQYAKGGVVVT